MEKDVSARAEGVKQISKEKARIFRKKTEAPSSLLEKAALAWKEKKEAEERQRQKERLKREESLELSSRETAAKEAVDYEKQELSDQSREVPSKAEEGKPRDETGWVQFRPWKEEEKKKDIEGSVSMSTIRALAKKLISGEWARVLGKKIEPPKFHSLETEAAIWKQKKEEEKRKKQEARRERIRQRKIKAALRREKRLAQRQKREEAKRKLARQKEILKEALITFSQKLGTQNESVDPKTAVAALEGVLGNVGEVLDISWQNKACWIWLEPWEEMKLRKAKGESLPIIYRARITDNLEIASFENIKDKNERSRLKKEFLIRPIKSSLEKIMSSIKDEARAKEELEKKLSEIGRIINIERKETGWLATIEPWEEMRIRNIKRGGKPPIVTDEIEISWNEGKLEFVNADNADISDNQRLGTQIDADISDNQRLGTQIDADISENQRLGTQIDADVSDNQRLKEGGKENERD